MSSIGRPRCGGGRRAKTERGAAAISALLVAAFKLSRHNIDSSSIAPSTSSSSSSSPPNFIVQKARRWLLLTLSLSSLHKTAAKTSSSRVLLLRCLNSTNVRWFFALSPGIRTPRALEFAQIHARIRKFNHISVLAAQDAAQVSSYP